MAWAAGAGALRPASSRGRVSGGSWMASSSASGPGGFEWSERTVSRQEAAPPPEPHKAELLDQVLRETLAICTSDEPLQPADLERFRRVARQYAGHALTAYPVGAELVYAVLEGHFADEGPAEEFWRGAAAEIAETLLSDAVAKPRLERFWARLSGEGR